MVATPLTPERRWYIASRWQEFEGEGRTNLLRLMAIAGFYGVHLVGYLGQDSPSEADQKFHRLATWLAAGWVFLSLAVLVALQRRFLPAALKYATTLMDAALLTALAAIGQGPRACW